MKTVKEMLTESMLSAIDGISDDVTELTFSYEAEVLEVRPSSASRMFDLGRRRTLTITWRTPEPEASR